MEKGWKDKLPDALWVYRTAYKTPIGMSPFQLVYGKSFHLPVELEHGCEASRQKSTKIDSRTRRMEREGVPQCQALQREN